MPVTLQGLERSQIGVLESYVKTKKRWFKAQRKTLERTGLRLFIEGFVVNSFLSVSNNVISSNSVFVKFNVQMSCINSTFGKT